MSTQPGLSEPVDLNKESIKKSLKAIDDAFKLEEKAVREAQVRLIRRAESFWQGQHDIFWNAQSNAWQTARDAVNDGLISEAQLLDYDKYVNIYKAHGKAIIAASSVEFPKYTFLPEDYDNPNDILASDAYAKVAEIIQRQNDGRNLLARAFYIRWNQDFLAIYNYHHFDPKFGFVPIQKENVEFTLDENGEPIPDAEGNIPPATITELEPKGREIFELYGPKHVTLPKYAMTLEDAPYLRLEKEFHISKVLDFLGKFRDDVKVQSYQFDDSDLRISDQYRRGGYPHVVTVSQLWLRPWAYWTLGKSADIDVELLKQEYPDGARVISVNDQIVVCINEKLDDHWTVEVHPDSDSIHSEPLGKDLICLNEIHNEVLQLTVETIKQSIPELFADPAVLNFKAYGMSEKAPGTVTPATPKAGFGLDAAFHETRSATLSKEVETFDRRLQEFEQLVVHAFPSIFGGTNVGGSKTFAEYAKSAQQALQVLALDYTPIVDCFAKAMKKAVKSFIDNMQGDSVSYTSKDPNKGIVSIFVDKAQASGNIGDVVLESAAQIPLSWSELRAIFMEMMGSNNPQLLSTFFNPENITYIKDIIGMRQLYVPGEADRKKQLFEIEELEGGVLDQPPGLPEAGMPAPMPQSSVMIDEADNHAIHIETIKVWEISEAGQACKKENPQGFANVMMHKKMHMMAMQAQQMQAQGPQGPTPANPEQESSDSLPPPPPLDQMGENDNVSH